MEIIIVAPCHVPLVIGGAERLWWGLLEHLNRDTPHVADIIKLPGPERNFAEVVDSYRRFSELDLRQYDLVLSSKYPAWMTDHPQHVCYMQHPLRGLYDTYPRDWPTEYESRHPDVAALLALLRSGDHTRAALRECFARIEALQGPSRPRRFRRPVAKDAFAFPGPLIREVVHFCDRVAFRPGAMRRVCAISRAVADREGYFPPGLEVMPVHHPSHLTGFHAPREGRYFFTVSRLDAPKRIDLVIEATKRVDGDVELLIAGTGPDESRLREIAGGDSRIRFLGFVDDDALLDLYAAATCVLFAPLDEDLGLVALEAMAAGKPVITTRDAGGAGEVVTDGDTGLVTDPTPDAIAAAMQRLQADRQLARDLGARGREDAAQVTWSRVSHTLFDAIGIDGNVPPSRR
jgi:glycosyltransferase involved in cell wall biosynthesis